jgi:hypothetical protein
VLFVIVYDPSRRRLQSLQAFDDGVAAAEATALAEADSPGLRVSCEAALSLAALLRIRPELVSPERMTADWAISHDGASHDGASHDGASHDGASHDGASPDGASPDGASPDGATEPRDPPADR